MELLPTNYKPISMKNIITLLLILTTVVLIIPISFRVRKDLKKKRNFANTYAIQNIGTGNCIRPYNAGIDNQTKIISYTHKNWECITWELIGIDSNTFLLKNLYSQKTFQPSSRPESGVGLWQQSMGGTPLQYWEFLKQANDIYLIRLKETELYLTVNAQDNNTPVVLMPKQETHNQQWKLIRQNPWI